MYSQSVFLDTNVMLDYLENRDENVSNIISQLLQLHRDNRIRLVTLILNIAELIDKDIEITFYGYCLKKRLSYDEIFKKKFSRMFLVFIENNGYCIKEKVIDFITNNKLEILYLDDSDIEEDTSIFTQLLHEKGLHSQDSLIVYIAYKNNVDYFLTNDNELAKKIGDMVYTYNLHNEDQLEFRDSVIEAIL